MLRKCLKTAGWILLSVLVLVLLASGFVSWLLFSRSGLKKTAEYAIEHYAPCRIDFKDIRLELLKTFPHVGLTLDDVVIYNNDDFSPSDTLAEFHNLTFQTDINAYRHENEIRIEKILLDDASAWLFTAEDGRSNLDMFTTGKEKAEKEEPLTFTLPDSLGTKLTFNLQRLKLSDISFRYTDNASHTAASIGNMDFDARGILSPSLTGDLDINLAVTGIDACIGDTTQTEADIADIRLTGTAGINNPMVNGNGNLTCTGIKMASGDLRAESDKISLDFDGSSNLKDKLLNGTLGMDIVKAVMKSVSMEASSRQMTLQINADGSYETGHPVTAALEGCIDNIAFLLKGENPMETHLNGLSLEGNATVLLSELDGDLDMSIRSNALDFRMAGENPVTLLSQAINVAISGHKDGAVLQCRPEISSQDIQLSLGDEKYLAGWPVELSLPISTDTTFSHFKLKGGAVSVNRQELHADAAIDLIRSGSIDASGSIQTRSLDLETIFSMLPASVRSSLEGIRLSGNMTLLADGEASVRDGNLNLHNASANIKASDFKGGAGDTLSASASSICVDMDYPGPGTDGDLYYATVSAEGLAAGISSASALTASLDKLNADAVLHNITDSTASDKYIKADILLNGIAAMMDTVSAAMDNLALNCKYDMVTKSGNGNKVSIELKYDTLSARMGSALEAQTGTAAVTASACMDTTRQEFVLRWKPELSVNVANTTIDNLQLPMSLPKLVFDFSLGEFRISESHVMFGNSDFSLAGRIRDIGAFLDGSGSMDGALDFASDHTDMDELLSFVSGMGCPDTLQATSAGPGTDSDNSVEASPFIVPQRMNIAFNTKISEMDFNRHRFHNLGGDITIKDGSLILQEVGFSSDAAEMQLTAIYDTPEPDDITASLDFHLLDIDINELIDLIPSVDSVVPMLKSFDGKAQFHMAVETSFTPQYEPIMSTLIGAAAIEGKDLKIMDNEVFDGIKHKLLMSRKAENKIDSLSVEMQVLRNQVELFPFLVHMDRYSVAIGGRHNINKALDCKYHISIIQTPLPIRLGVNVEGSVADISASPLKHIKLTKCKYDKTFNPERVNATDQRILEMKQIISNTLKSTVK